MPSTGEDADGIGQYERRGETDAMEELAYFKPTLAFLSGFIDLLTSSFVLQQNEFGGYFIVNGIERCVRLLQVPRRNHPTAIKRSNFKNRGPAFTDMGVSIRCCRRNGDQSSITNTVHYLSSGGASFRFTARKQEFLIPLVILLRALSSSSFGSSDEELYSRIVEGAENNTFLRARAELLLQDAHQFDGLHTSEECLAYLGARFRPLSLRADSTSDVDIGHFMMER